MTTYITNLFPCLGTASTRNRVLPALFAGLGLVLAGRATAQTFTTLHSFSGGNEGFSPGVSILWSPSLYGTAQGGSGGGAVFKVNIDGTGVTNVYSFAALSGVPSTNIDGAVPQPGLVLSSNTLYGTARDGGSSGRGTVFKVKTDGAGFMVLHTFTAGSGTALNVTNGDGAYPFGGLIISGNILYGTAFRGGISGRGTVFAVSIDGTGFTNLHNFTSLQRDSLTGSFTNSDGANPEAELTLENNVLYGTAVFGGASGSGTVFAISADGTGFTNLHNFALLSPNLNSGTNTDGASPHGLILSGNTLYGTAGSGGSSGKGSVFAINNDGTGFTNLHSFTMYAANPTTNTDGTYPNAGLIISGTTLYGTAKYGGNAGMGTIFSIRTDGIGFSSLYHFTALPVVYPYTNSDGVNPIGRLILSGNTLYGTAAGGGSFNEGTVFSISFTPQLSITPYGTNVILAWPTNVAGFDYTGYTLQSTTNLGLPVWNTNLPLPVVVSGQNTVTNPISSAQQFFRLKH